MGSTFLVAAALAAMAQGPVAGPVAGPVERPVEGHGPGACEEGRVHGPEEYQQAVPTCPEGTETCLGIALFVLADGQGTVVEPAWVAGQIERANVVLEPLGVTFELAQVEVLQTQNACLHSRQDRDDLGATRWKKEIVNVFVVRKADDVDKEGEIWGVHWRWRKNTSRRWIILVSEAWPLTLGHELGHFFGLPHCKLQGSVMNKTGKDLVAMEERRFKESEVATMKKRLLAKLKSRELVKRTPSPATPAPAAPPAAASPPAAPPPAAPPPAAPPTAAPDGPQN